MWATAKRISGVRFAYDKCLRFMLKLRPAEAIFSSIFFGNKWGGKESVSGRGSDLIQTRVIRSELKSVYSGFHIQTILDIPCGDFYWMNHVDLEGMDYTGAISSES